MAQKESPPTGGGNSSGLICTNNMKKSLHTQRMLSAFGMEGFVKQAHRFAAAVPSDSSSDEEPHQYSGSSDESEEFGSKFYHQAAARSYRERMFDFSTVGSERMWLKNLLLSETETESEISDVEEYIQQMLKEHKREKKIREMYNDSPKNSQYGYYSAGLLSDNDLFPEHRRSAAGKRKCKIDHGTGKTKGVRKKMKHAKKRSGGPEGNSYSADGSSSSMRGPMFGDKKSQKLLQLQRGRPVASKHSDGSGFDHLPDQDGSSVGAKRGRKMRLKTPEALNIRRRKMWQLMAKKEVGKLQRAKANNHKDTITNCRRVAALCMRVARQKAMQSQKLMKDTVWRAKRLTREMQVYWKRYDKVERETKRRMEREAEEQRKIDVEIVEAKRQQRKLNFLITQTELYAHFMSRKLGNVSAEEQLKILSQLDEESNPRLAAIDNYDCERMKQLAQKNATEAFRNERARTNQFDVVQQQTEPALPAANAVSMDESKANAAEEMVANRTEPSTGIAELPQPTMFRGRLKGYQLKGVAWLANLYDQGISGILADEMGLGKTVQSIAFLCHIAEHYGVWGPFLVISPASTLHNWQQEMERFVPEFNVVPYWGSPNERKILRQFWEQKHLHTKDASFHVVITSYQLVVTDYKYFNRIKWQYMVLDEAQAIKSSSSMRWKLLLGFNCRNRLLLSGTPIQNSMAELWALLHFIMPTLFDSHEEFNEWFSKDIESHAENKTGIDEKQISRLHMILKPFMLRRIKKDVENELSDKIEIMVYCPLTTRQKLLYVALKKEICIEDLLHLTTVGGGSGDGQSIDRNFTSNLMNLVMQFRKVCNHPELFERRDVRSPFCMKWSYELAERPIFRRQLLMDYTVPSKRHWLHNRCYIFNAEQVLRRSTEEDRSVSTVPVERSRSKASPLTRRTVSRAIHYDDWCAPFSCARLAGGLSPKQIEQTARRNVFWFIYQLIEEWVHWIAVLHFRWVWRDKQTSTWTDPRYMLLEPSAERWTGRCFPWKTMERLLFTHTVHSAPIPVYTHRDHVLHFTSETLDHRIMRSRKQQIPGQPLNLLPEVPYVPTRRPSTVLPNEPTAMPKFLCRHYTKVLNTAGCTGSALSRMSLHTNGTTRWHCSESGAAAERQLNRHVHASYPPHGWSNIIIPDKQTLVSDAGKLAVLDSLLARLKEQGHRVLIYSQMTKMIDLLEEYMWHRKHRYMRLDGSSKISERRDMVADFQNRADIFVFLLSTRAGGLGINLTAADTVIFYDSDWNPTVDQQAMDRAHRLGQTKQVTVYRLICKGTIEERILQRAREKSEIQRMVINGDNFKPDTLKPKEVVSLLLDDEEIELKYRQKTEERRLMEDPVGKSSKERDRKQKQSSGKDTAGKDRKRAVELGAGASCDEPGSFGDSAAPSPAQSERSNLSDNTNKALDALDDSSNEASSMSFDVLREQRDIKARPVTRGASKRGRPRGSRRGGAAGAGSTRPVTTEQQTIPDKDNSNPAAPSLPVAPLAAPVVQVRRGPGRPRLKTNGPSNQGTRGPHVRQTIRIRKPIGPLVVPLGGQSATPSGGGATRLLSSSSSASIATKAATPSNASHQYPASSFNAPTSKPSARPGEPSQTVPSTDNLTIRQQSIPPAENDSGTE
uniref:Chromatin-remodeling ATPase INO80 n=1 Tax=Anopheles culicifacies TaxID=139723 RepID=A0A182MB26_9DIPT